MRFNRKLLAVFQLLLVLTLPLGMINSVFAEENQPVPAANPPAQDPSQTTDLGELEKQIPPEHRYVWCVGCDKELTGELRTAIEQGNLHSHWAYTKTTLGVWQTTPGVTILPGGQFVKEKTDEESAIENYQNALKLTNDPLLKSLIYSGLALVKSYKAMSFVKLAAKGGSVRNAGVYLQQAIHDARTALELNPDNIMAKQLMLGLESYVIDSLISVKHANIGSLKEEVKRFLSENRPIQQEMIEGRLVDENLIYTFIRNLWPGTWAKTLNYIFDADDIMIEAGEARITLDKEVLALMLIKDLMKKGNSIRDLFSLMPEPLWTGSLPPQAIQTYRLVYRDIILREIASKTSEKSRTFEQKLLEGLEVLSRNPDLLFLYNHANPIQGQQTSTVLGYAPRSVTYFPVFEGEYEKTVTPWFGTGDIILIVVTVFTPYFWVRTPTILLQGGKFVKLGRALMLTGESPLGALVGGNVGRALLTKAGVQAFGKAPGIVQFLANAAIDVGSFAGIMLAEALLSKATGLQINVFSNLADFIYKGDVIENLLERATKQIAKKSIVGAGIYTKTILGDTWWNQYGTIFTEKLEQKWLTPTQELRKDDVIRLFKEALEEAGVPGDSIDLVLQQSDLLLKQLNKITEEELQTAYTELMKPLLEQALGVDPAIAKAVAALDKDLVKTPGKDIVYYVVDEKNLPAIANDGLSASGFDDTLSLEPKFVLDRFKREEGITSLYPVASSYKLAHTEIGFAELKAKEASKTILKVRVDPKKTFVADGELFDSISEDINRMYKDLNPSYAPGEFNIDASLLKTHPNWGSLKSKMDAYWRSIVSLDDINNQYLLDSDGLAFVMDAGNLNLPQRIARPRVLVSDSLTINDIAIARNSENIESVMVSKGLSRPDELTGVRPEQIISTETDKIKNLVENNFASSDLDPSAPWRKKGEEDFSSQIINAFGQDVPNDLERVSRNIANLVDSLKSGEVKTSEDAYDVLVRNPGVTEKIVGSRVSGSRGEYLPGPSEKRLIDAKHTEIRKKIADEPSVNPDALKKGDYWFSYRFKHDLPDQYAVRVYLNLNPDLQEEVFSQLITKIQKLPLTARADIKTGVTEKILRLRSDNTVLYVSKEDLPQVLNVIKEIKADYEGKGLRPFQNHVPLTTRKATEGVGLSYGTPDESFNALVSNAFARSVSDLAKNEAAKKALYTKVEKLISEGNTKEAQDTVDKIIFDDDYSVFDKVLVKKLDEMISIARKGCTLGSLACGVVDDINKATELAQELQNSPVVNSAFKKIFEDAQRPIPRLSFFGYPTLRRVDVIYDYSFDPLLVNDRLFRNNVERRIKEALESAEISPIIAKYKVSKISLVPEGQLDLKKIWNVGEGGKLELVLERTTPGFPTVIEDASKITYDHLGRPTKFTYQPGDRVKLTRSMIDLDKYTAERIVRERQSYSGFLYSKMQEGLSEEKAKNALVDSYKNEPRKLEELLRATWNSGHHGIPTSYANPFVRGSSTPTVDIGYEVVYELSVPAERIIKIRFDPNTGEMILPKGLDIDSPDIHSYGFVEPSGDEGEITFLHKIPDEYITSIKVSPVLDSQSALQEITNRINNLNQDSTLSDIGQAIKALYYLERKEIENEARELLFKVEPLLSQKLEAQIKRISEELLDPAKDVHDLLKEVDFIPNLRQVIGTITKGQPPSVHKTSLTKLTDLKVLITDKRGVLLSIMETNPGASADEIITKFKSAFEETELDASFVLLEDLLDSIKNSISRSTAKTWSFALKNAAGQTVRTDIVKVNNKYVQFFSNQILSKHGANTQLVGSRFLDVQGEDDLSKLLVEVLDGETFDQPMIRKEIIMDRPVGTESLVEASSRQDLERVARTEWDGRVVQEKVRETINPNIDSVAVIETSKELPQTNRIFVSMAKFNPAFYDQTALDNLVAQYRIITGNPNLQVQDLPDNVYGVLTLFPGKEAPRMPEIVIDRTKFPDDAAYQKAVSDNQEYKRQWSEKYALLKRKQVAEAAPLKSLEDIIKSDLPDNEILAHLLDKSRKPVPGLPLNVERGFSDEEIGMLLTTRPEVARKLDIKKAVGYGYEHARKHTDEFVQYGGLEKVLKDTQSKTSELEIPSRGTTLKIHRLSEIGDAEQRFVISIYAGSEHHLIREGKFVTLYDAVQADSRFAGKKSILHTLEGAEKGLYRSSDQSVNYLKLEEKDGVTKYLKYEKVGDQVIVTFRTSKTDEFQKLVGGYEFTDKQVSKKIKSLRESVPPDKVIINLANMGVSHLASKQILDLTDITIIKKLGEGSNGVVHLIEVEGKKYAFKTATEPDKIAKLIKEFEMTDLVSDLPGTAKAFKKVQKNGQIIGFLQEYIEGRNLGELLSDPLTVITESQFKQIEEIFENLHRVNVLHGDVRLRNIMIDKTGNARLIDFGESAVYPSKALFEISSLKEQKDLYFTLLELIKKRASLLETTGGTYKQNIEKELIELIKRTDKLKNALKDALDDPTVSFSEKTIIQDEMLPAVERKQNELFRELGVFSIREKGLTVDEFGKILKKAKNFMGGLVDVQTFSSAYKDLMEKKLKEILGETAGIRIDTKVVDVGTPDEHTEYFVTVFANGETVAEAVRDIYPHSSKNYIKLSELEVFPKHAGKGVGSAFYQAEKEIFRDQGLNMEVRSVIVSPFTAHLITKNYGAFLGNNPNLAEIVAGTETQHNDLLGKVYRQEFPKTTSIGTPTQFDRGTELYAFGHVFPEENVEKLNGAMRSNYNDEVYSLSTKISGLEALVKVPGKIELPTNFAEVYQGTLESKLSHALGKDVQASVIVKVVDRGKLKEHYDIFTKIFVDGDESARSWRQVYVHPDNKKIVLDTISVDRDFKGAGIGSTIYKTEKDLFRSQGLDLPIQSHITSPVTARFVTQHYGAFLSATEGIPDIPTSIREEFNDDLMKIFNKELPVVDEYGVPVYLDRDLYAFGYVFPERHTDEIRKLMEAHYTLEAKESALGIAGIKPAREEILEGIDIDTFKTRLIAESEQAASEIVHKQLVSMHAIERTSDLVTKFSEGAPKVQLLSYLDSGKNKKAFLGRMPNGETVVVLVHPFPDWVRTPLTSSEAPYTIEKINENIQGFLDRIFKEEVDTARNVLERKQIGPEVVKTGHKVDGVVDAGTEVAYATKYINGKMLGEVTQTEVDELITLPPPDIMKQLEDFFGRSENKRTTFESMPQELYDYFFTGSEKRDTLSSLFRLAKVLDEEGYYMWDLKNNVRIVVPHPGVKEIHAGREYIKGEAILVDTGQVEPASSARKFYPSSVYETFSDWLAATKRKVSGGVLSSLIPVEPEDLVVRTMPTLEVKEIIEHTSVKSADFGEVNLASYGLQSTTFVESSQLVPGTCPVVGFAGVNKRGILMTHPTNPMLNLPIKKGAYDELLTPITDVNRAKIMLGALDPSVGLLNSNKHVLMEDLVMYLNIKGSTKENIKGYLKKYFLQHQFSVSDELLDQAAEQMLKQLNFLQTTFPDYFQQLRSIKQTGKNIIPLSKWLVKKLSQERDYTELLFNYHTRGVGLSEEEIINSMENVRSKLAKNPNVFLAAIKPELIIDNLEEGASRKLLGKPAIDTDPEEARNAVDALKAKFWNGYSSGDLCLLLDGDKTLLSSTLKQKNLQAVPVIYTSYSPGIDPSALRDVQIAQLFPTHGDLSVASRFVLKDETNDFMTKKVLYKLSGAGDSVIVFNDKVITIVVRTRDGIEMFRMTREEYQSIASKLSALSQKESDEVITSTTSELNEALSELNQYRVSADPEKWVADKDGKRRVVEMAGGMVATINIVNQRLSANSLFCGNGELNEGEECDPEIQNDPNIQPGYYCSADCKILQTDASIVQNAIAELSNPELNTREKEGIINGLARYAQSYDTAYSAIKAQLQNNELKSTTLLTLTFIERTSSDQEFNNIVKERYVELFRNRVSWLDKKDIENEYNVIKRYLNKIKQEPTVEEIPYYEASIQATQDPPRETDPYAPPIQSVTAYAKTETGEEWNDPRTYVTSCVDQGDYLLVGPDVDFINNNDQNIGHTPSEIQNANNLKKYVIRYGKDVPLGDRWIEDGIKDYYGIVPNTCTACTDLSEYQTGSKICDHHKYSCTPGPLGTFLITESSQRAYCSIETKNIGGLKKATLAEQKYFMMINEAEPILNSARSRLGTSVVIMGQAKPEYTDFIQNKCPTLDSLAWRGTAPGITLPPTGGEDALQPPTEGQLPGEEGVSTTTEEEDGIVTQGQTCRYVRPFFSMGVQADCSILEEADRLLLAGKFHKSPATLQDMQSLPQVAQALINSFPGMAPLVNQLLNSLNLGVVVLPSGDWRAQTVGGVCKGNAVYYYYNHADIKIAPCEQVVNSPPFLYNLGFAGSTPTGGFVAPITGGAIAQITGMPTLTTSGELQVVETGGLCEKWTPSYHATLPNAPFYYVFQIFYNRLDDINQQVRKTIGRRTSPPPPKELQKTEHNLQFNGINAVLKVAKKPGSNLGFESGMDLRVEADGVIFELPTEFKNLVIKDSAGNVVNRGEYSEVLKFWAHYFLRAEDITFFGKQDYQKGYTNSWTRMSSDKKDSLAMKMIYGALLLQHPGLKQQIDIFNTDVKPLLTLLPTSAVLENNFLENARKILTISFLKSLKEYWARRSSNAYTDEEITRIINAGVHQGLVEPLYELTQDHSLEIFTLLNKASASDMSLNDFFNLVGVLAMNDLALNNLYSTKPLEVRDFLAKLVDQGKLFYKEVIAELLTKILLIELSPQNQKELINLLGQLTGSETAFETLASLCRGPYFEDVLEESYTALSKVDPYKSLEVINSCKKLELVEPEEKLEEKPLSSGLKVQPLTPETASACVQRTAKIEFVSYINGEITAQVSNLAGRDQEVIAVASIADAEGFKRIERQVEIPEEGGIITIPYAVRGLDGMNVDFYLSTGQGIIDALRSEGVNKGLSGREVPR